MYPGLSSCGLHSVGWHCFHLSYFSSCCKKAPGWKPLKGELILPSLSNEGVHSVQSITCVQARISDRRTISSAIGASFQPSLLSQGDLLPYCRRPVSQVVLELIELTTPANHSTFYGWYVENCHQKDVKFCQFLFLYLLTWSQDFYASYF